MKTLLHNLFLNNWRRKCLSVILAVIVWLLINQSLTAPRTISNIPMRIINIPVGKTVQGLQSNGYLKRKITLTLVGNKTLLDELTSNDLEVVIDAADKPDQWIVSISKKNLVSLNPEIDLSKAISRVHHQSFPIRLTKLVSEKIPILVTQPIGDAPRDYQFLDVWPYQLTLTVTGPEEVIQRVKAKELKLTFNLNDISKAQLDTLQASKSSPKGDVVSFFVPDKWKQISLPLLSDNPIEIDDPQAKALRIDFIRCNLLPIDRPIPVTLFFPPEYSNLLNPENCTLAATPLIKEINGLFILTDLLYTKGVSHLFMQIVRDMLEIVIIVSPKPENDSLEWSVQFINPRLLEDRYVEMLSSDVSDEELRVLQPNLREDYLRNRFRSYMNRFQLFKSQEEKLKLDVKLKGNKVEVSETETGS